MSWLLDFMTQGGPVLWAILLLCVVLWSLILERLWFYRISLPGSNRQLAERWRLRNEFQSWEARKIRAYWLSQQKQALEQYLPLIGILIAVCPLLGLLGTVRGMISVFDVLAITGTGNARAMANGISQATIPTMAGLVVALTGLYFRTRFKRLSQRGLQQLADSLE